MINWLAKVFRFIFLVKEIISREGIVHFRRYRLISTPWFNLYLHHICQSDKDGEPHDHPWNFQSLIVKGAYQEYVYGIPEFNRYYAGDVVQHKATDAHRITLLSKEVWTLVYTSGGDRHWGYRLSDGSWIGHEEYRQIKNELMGRE